MTTPGGIGGSASSKIMGKVNDLIKDPSSSDAEQAALQTVPGFSKGAPVAPNGEASGNLGGGGGGFNSPQPLGYPMPPPGPANGMSGSARTITLNMLQSVLADPEKSVMNCVMVLLQDALETQTDARKQQQMAQDAQIGNAMANYAETMKDVADTKSDAQAKYNADMTSAVTSIVAGGLSLVGAGLSIAGAAGGWSQSSMQAISATTGAINQIAGGIGKLEDAQKDAIDANSATLQDKVTMANLELQQKILDASAANKKTNSDDATDHLHNMRDLMSKIWQSRVENMQAARFNK